MVEYLVYSTNQIVDYPVYRSNQMVEYLAYSTNQMVDYPLYRSNQMVDYLQQGPVRSLIWLTGWTAVAAI
jgi:hypothetical protein